MLIVIFAKTTMVTWSLRTGTYSYMYGRDILVSAPDSNGCNSNRKRAIYIAPFESVLRDDPSSTGCTGLAYGVSILIWTAVSPTLQRHLGSLFEFQIDRGKKIIGLCLFSFLFPCLSFTKIAAPGKGSTRKQNGHGEVRENVCL